MLSTAGEDYSAVLNSQDSDSILSMTEMLVRAIADNDCPKFLKAIKSMGMEAVASLTFDHGMNVLNLAID